MRISGDQGDPGYAPLALLRSRGLNVRVLFDGEEVRNCFIADEALGQIVIAQRDDDGHLIYEDGAPKRYRLLGKVELVICDASQA